MIAFSWSDVDLSAFAFEPSIDKATIDLSSNYDGADVASIVCLGNLVVRINSALAANLSTMPIMIGEVVVRLLSERALDEALSSFEYGFRFEENRSTPHGLLAAYHVRIEGGELQADIIAVKCNVMNHTLN